MDKRVVKLRREVLKLRKDISKNTKWLGKIIGRKHISDPMLEDIARALETTASSLRDLMAARNNLEFAEGLAKISEE